MESIADTFQNILFSAVCIIYLLPLVIASARRHHNHVAISVLNIFFGFTC